MGVPGKPLLITDHVKPLFDDKNAPKFVPAKIFVPFTKKVLTAVTGMPIYEADQFPPLLVDLKTPAFVPAKMSVPFNAKDKIRRLVKPVLIAVQLFPLLDDKYAPLSVPTKIFPPLITIANTVSVDSFLDQTVPLFTDKNNPPNNCDGKNICAVNCDAFYTSV